MNRLIQHASTDRGCPPSLTQVVVEDDLHLDEQMKVVRRQYLLLAACTVLISNVALQRMGVVCYRPLPS